ncbi:hypothetical protein [Vibrio phage LP.2]|nr:hypothetical protein [Vibrio phage LP.2]
MSKRKSNKKVKQQILSYLNRLDQYEFNYSSMAGGFKYALRKHGAPIGLTAASRWSNFHYGASKL